MKKINNLSGVKPFSYQPGHYRRTLTADEQIMMCMYNMDKGTVVDLHSHEAAQIGYILNGEINFFDDKGNSVIGGPGFSYCFDPNEVHGCSAVTECEFLECFSPCRPEYDN